MWIVSARGCFTTRARLVVDAQGPGTPDRPKRRPRAPIAATIDSADAALNAAIVLDALGA
jgi:hypothetical protein